MDNKCLTIISRYKEDISWAKDLKGDILIYNKSDDFPFDFPKTNVPNVGREAETFVRSVVENYDIIKNYQYVIFLQGFPFDHCPDLYTNLDLESDSYIYLTKSRTLHTTNFQNDDVYLFNKNIIVFEQLFNKRISKMTFEMSNLINSSTVNASEEVEEIIFVLDFIGIPYKNKDLFWGTGAQYKVPTKLILNKSFNWWMELFKFMWFAEDYVGVNNIAHIFERIWPLIWEYENND